MQVECTVRGSNPKEGTAQILHDADLNACNSFEQPDRVAPKQYAVKVEGGKVRIDLPRLSIVAATVPIS
jgi:alpha-N-arabinofuranosidase